MTGSDQSGFKVVEAFPWIERALSQKTTLSGDEDLSALVEKFTKTLDWSETSDVDCTRQIVRLAFEALPEWNLARIFPYVPLSLDLNSEALDGIAPQRTAGAQFATFEEISPTFISDVAEFRSWGVTSLTRFLESLAQLNLAYAKAIRSEHAEELAALARNEISGHSEQVEERTQTKSLGDVLTSENQSVIGLIDTLMGWLAESKQSQVQPFDFVFDTSTAPANVLEALAALRALTPEKWAGLPEPSDAVFELVEDFVSSFNDRDLKILRGRWLSQPRQSLDALGHEFGVTRERIRQLEAPIGQRVSAWFEKNIEVTLHSRIIRNHVGKLGRLSSLLEKYPALQEIIVGLDMPAWYVFDQFDDSFESDGEWVAVPSLKNVATQFDEVFATYESEYGYVEVEVLQKLLPENGFTDIDATLDWAESRKYKRIGEILIAPQVRSMNGLGIAVLASTGKPTTEVELHALVAPNQTIRSFSNQMASDPRAIRAGAGIWALAGWGNHAYQSIRDEIAKRVDKDGSYPLAALISELTTNFAVAESSVRAYANSWPFEVVHGAVKKALRPTLPSRPLNRSRSVVHLDGGYAYRFEASKDTLRGSGFPIPGTLAAVLGLQPGGEMEFAPTDGEKPITLRWNGNQPSCATIRENVEHLGVELGDIVAITFKSGISNVIRLGPPSESAATLARQILVLPADAPLTLVEVRQGLGLGSDADELDIIQIATVRHDEALLEALRELGIISKSSAV